MPPRGLPGNANIEQLKNGAKSFQRAVRAGDAGAVDVVREFHPRFERVEPGAPELQRFTRADAQLVVARSFNFPSWPKLKAHLELVARFARSPHDEPVGGALADEQAIADEFLRLATLNYGNDEPARLQRAELLLDAHDWLAGYDIFTIAATGELRAGRELLDADPTQASRVGGPHQWEPLLYLTYSRVGFGSEGSAVAVARLLLEHGADPNAGYLWEGLVPPFTALTGALGGGGEMPKHPQELELARLLLEAGADANDGQALYNRAGDPDEGWVTLLLEFGLGTGDGGRWRRLLGERQDSPREMVEDLLMSAAGHGFTGRVRTLLARGVDPDGRGSRHPIYHGRSPVQEAALAGQMEVVSLLVEAGASWQHDQVDELLASTPAAAAPGVAMRTVAAAFTAVSEGRFDELGPVLASEIDWRGLPDEDGHVPRCRGRDQALERMRIGRLAGGAVSVSAFVEEGDRVLAHVHRADGEELDPAEHFVVAEVHDGQITQLRGYATEPEAREALHGEAIGD